MIGKFCAIAVLFCISCTVFAQNLINDNDVITEPGLNRLEQVTVIGNRATKDAELGGVNLVELPISVFVVSREEIERIRFVDPDDFLDRIPGETQVRNLRIPNGGKPYTLPLVDGMPLENPYDGATSDISRINSFDIERVEIIKGPASALYGNNAFGGVVNVVTRGIPKEQESRAWVEGGDFGHLRAGFNSGGAFNDKLGYFVDINTLQLDGLRDNYVDPNPNNYPDAVKNDRTAVSGKLQYEPSNQTKVTMRYEYLDRSEVTATDIPQSAFDRDPTLILSNRAGNPDVSFEDAESLATYIKIEKRLTAGMINFSGVARSIDFQGDGRFSAPKIETQESVNAKLWYRHDLKNSDIILGGEHYRGETEADIYGDNDLNFTGQAIGNVNTNLDITALFTQYSFSASPVVDINLGLRHEKIRADSILGEAEFDDLAPKFGITYQANNDNMIWLGISEGFLAPSPEDLFDPSEGNPNLKPEEALHIEFGLRGEIGSWLYNSSYYNTNIENYLFTQEIDTDNDGAFDTEQTSNAAQVTVEGVESVLEYIPTESWRLGITHTYARNVFDSFVQSAPGASDDFSGNSLSRSPKHHLNTRVAWLPIDTLIVELEGDFYTGYTTSDANDDPLGEFTRDERIDIRINYEMNNWTLWFNGLNLTDTKEDRVSYSARRNARSYRLINGRNYQIGASLAF